MLIEKIELKNFGIHRDLCFEPGRTGNVVGLLGANGSGKSTILEALKYAFTGDLAGTLESYRSANSSENGRVDVRFLKDGVRGEISRQVGSGRLRSSFKWGDDAVITAKKTLDAKLEEILGVDKKALSNAIFLPQGKLDNLLFGTKAEREELFVKLVNMSYCQRRSEVLALKSKKLKSEIVDMEATIIEAEHNLAIAETDEKQLSDDLSSLHDYSKDIEILYEKEKLENDVSTSTMYLTEEQANLTLSKKEVANFKEGLEVFRAGMGYEDSMSYDDMLESRKVMYNTLVHRRTEVVENINKIQNYEKLEQRLKTVEEDIEKTKTDLNDLFSKKTTFTVTQEELDELRTQTGELKFEADQTEKWRNKLVALLGGETTTAVCPVCLTTTHAEHFQDISEFDTMVANRQKALQAVQTVLEDKTKSYIASKNEETTRSTALEQTTFRLGTLTKEKTRITEELREYEDVNVAEKSDKAVLETLQKSISELADENERFHETKTNWKNSRNNVEKSEVAIEKTKVLLRDLTEKLRTLEEKVEDTTELPLEEMKARQSLRDKVSGRLEQAQATLTDARRRYEELLAKREKDGRVLEIVKDIDVLSDIFARKGLPREYVYMKFRKLMEKTQSNLNVLSADFTITCDEEDSLSFRFQRHDGSEHVELPMSKLSGGQRVRLCTAFLLACQKELVSDVGLMTFDEPSTHLDDEGVENLQTLFETLQRLFKESEYQIWISDHHPDLEKSFNKTLKLS